ncbi:MAG: SH3 domain-containing protein [Beutenbergiaceae bacterium]
MNVHRAIAIFLASATLTGCQFITDPSPESATSTAASPSPVVTAEEPEPEATQSPPSPTPPTQSQLPGAVATGYPSAGTALTIIAVPATEILNLRLGPGTTFASIARLPAAADLVATGHNRILSAEELWYEVRADGELGWVSAQFVAQLGASRDVTDSFDPLPSAPNRTELINAVVAAWDRTAAPDATVVFGPIEQEDLQVRIDILTPGDDSVLGARLFLVADNDAQNYVVTKVMATQLCARGVTGTGDCR